MNPLDLVGWLKTAAYMAAALAIGLVVGYVYGHHHGIVDDKAQAQVQYDKVARENTSLAIQEQVQEQQIEDLTFAAHQEVHLADIYVPAPGLAPVALPDPGYNNAFVCLWNLPIHGDTGGPGSAAAAACAHAPDAYALSVATRDDILNNELENMGKCAIAYDRVAALQQALKNAGH